MESTQPTISIDRLNLLLLNMGHALHNADWNWKNVNSPFARIFYVVAGRACLHMHGKDFVLLPHHMYLIPPFTMHSYSCESEFELYYLHIYEDGLRHDYFFTAFDYPAEAEAGPLDLKLIERLCQINPSIPLPSSNPVVYDNCKTLLQSVSMNKQRTLSIRVESRGIVYQLVSRFLFKARPKPMAGDLRIQKTVAYIRKHISQNIGIEELATQTCVSKDHLIRLFKKDIGEPPLQYINRKKLKGRNCSW